MEVDRVSAAGGGKTDGGTDTGRDEDRATCMGLKRTDGMSAGEDDSTDEVESTTAGAASCCAIRTTDRSCCCLARSRLKAM